jgi:type I restriction enzyme S subunit
MEQIRISKIFAEIDKLIVLAETKLQKLKLQKQGMMQALLTGKIRLI